MARKGTVTIGPYFWWAEHFLAEHLADRELLATVSTIAYSWCRVNYNILNCTLSSANAKASKFFIASNP